MYQIRFQALPKFSQNLHASGGGAKSDIWLQILSDFLGVPITVQDNSDSEILGAAVLEFTDESDGMCRIIAFKKQYEPHSWNHEIYQYYLNLFILIYEKQ